MPPDAAARERLELDRQWVRETASCPRCHAEIGAPCIGRKYFLTANHRERTDLAVNHGYGSRPD